MLTSTSTSLNNIISSSHQLILTPMHNRYEIISEIMKNIIHFTHFLRLYNESLSKYPIFKCNNNSQWEIGSEFTLLIEEHIQIHFRLKSLIETDYYMHVEYFAYKTEPESFQYSFIINVHYISPNTCLLITNYMYPNSVHLSPTKTLNETKRRRKIYKNMEYKIIQGFYRRFNIEYVNIHIPMNLIWELLLNLKALHKFVHILGDKIDYEGKILSKGTNIKILSRVPYIKNNYVEQQAEVISLKQMEMECEIVFHTVQHDFKNTHEYIIKLFLYKGEGNNSCTVYMINLFDCDVDSKVIKELGTKKKHILTHLKTIMESYMNMLNKIPQNVVNGKNNSNNKNLSNRL